MICRPVPSTCAKPLSRHQAFRYGAVAYGLQFHVEMTPEMMELWLREFDRGESSSASGDFDPAVVRSAAAEAFPAMNSFSQCLLSRFAELCRERCRPSDCYGPFGKHPFERNCPFSFWQSFVLAVTMKLMDWKRTSRERRV